MSVFRDLLDNLRERFFVKKDVPTIKDPEPNVRVEFSCILNRYTHAQSDPLTWSAVIYVDGAPLENSRGEVIYGEGYNGEEAFKSLLRKMPPPSS